MLACDRFAGKIFSDRYGNAAFPHYQNGTVCGLELKNAKRGLLVKGSRKSFWRSNTRTKDTTVVVTEAVIDALSYQQLFQPADAFYLASGGGVSANQCRLLSDLLAEMTQITKVIIATDNDQGGDRIAKRVLEAIHRSSFRGQAVRHRPIRDGEDWNDALRCN